MFAGGPASGVQQQSAPKQKRWGKQRPYYGRVVAIEGLCNITSSDDKDTIRVEVDLGDSALTYIPGDALGIQPTNCPQVRACLWPTHPIGISFLHVSLHCPRILAVIASCMQLSA